MAIKTETPLSLVLPDRVLQPSREGEKRNSLLHRLWKRWQFLQSARGQRCLAWGIILALLVIDSVLVGQHALMRYQSYHADAFDLGNMDQAVWNTLHGHFFRFTNRGLDWYGPPTRLGVHVEPILLLIAPLYLLHSGPETLLLLQTVALALGGIPLFLLGLRRLPEFPLMAAASVAAYLSTPEILGEALYDFHAVALATPLLLLALWALETRRYHWFVGAAVLAALCKEEVALSLVPLGLVIAFWQGRPRLGAAICLLSISWVALCFLVILPHFNPQAAGANNFWYRYDWLGGSPDTALKHVLMKPSLLLLPLQDPARRGYLAELLSTGGGLGLFSPILWLSALPDTAINILSTHQEQFSGFFQYNAVILPYLMAATVSGIAALYRARRHVEFGKCSAILLKREYGALRTARSTRATRMLCSITACWEAAVGHLPIPSRWIGPLVIAWLVVSAFWNLATTDALVKPFWTAGSHPIPRQAQVNALLARVPANASVAATDSLDPHLSDRYTLYLMPDPQSYLADYVALDLPDALNVNRQADQQMYEAMRISGSYRILGTAGQVVLLQRISLPQPAQSQVQKKGWGAIIHFVQ
ncbi:MAG TPA: DUF2079 domain-containing protein [Ktedonobacteraceae bacterium]|nr:DUF2079 domain-containing protein [Ktedonobacteraceae bacterium]